ncbi:MAG: VPLPA-CTERM sorting domain-containing protein [Paracoccaceae bacterium]
MSMFDTIRANLAGLAAAACLTLGAGSAGAATVQVTLDFGSTTGPVSSPYIEDGFELAGNALFLSSVGNPFPAIGLDALTPSLTLTRTGGGLFSLVSFQYSCDGGPCDFRVGNTPITSGSSGDIDFATISPAGFSDVTSVVFATSSTNLHRLDNIVLSFDDMAAVPLPAGLPLLLAGLGGLALAARRRHRA